MRINISLPSELKDEWDSFREEIHLTMSQLIRNAVEEYKRKYEKENKKEPQIKELNEKINEKMDEMSKMMEKIAEMKEKQPIETESNELKIRGAIINLLSKSEHLTLDDIASILFASKEEIMQSLSIMQKNKMIKREREGWTLAQ